MQVTPKEDAMIRNLALAGLMLLASLVAAPGAWKQLGKTADYANTIDGVAFGGKLYTIEKDGTLYATSLKDGTYKTLGKKEFANTRLLWASENDLISLERDGSLYRIDTMDGSWKGIGKKGDWKGTIAADVLGRYLYSVESDGKLYRTDLRSGSWGQIGKADFANTVYLGAVWDFIITIEKDGTMYKVDPKTGSWSTLMKAGEWGNTIAACTMAEMGKYLYTIEKSGILYKTDLLANKYISLGKADFANTAFMTYAGDGKVVTIEKEGTCYLVEVE